jgi:putative membrane protein
MSKSNRYESILFISIITALYLITIVAKVISAPVGFLGVVVTVVFMLLHGTKFYGIRNIVFFIVVTFGISWCLESLSIAIGFPFGNYHYTGAGKIGKYLG